MEKETVETKKTFSENHPIINSIISLVILGCLIWVVYLFLKKLLYSLFALLSAVSKLDAVIIVALITGGVSILGVVISSIVAKWYDYKSKRSQYLAQKREEPYSEFLAMLFKLMDKKNTYSEEDIISDMNMFSEKLTLWGSNKVIKKWLAFRENAIEKKGSDEMIFVMEDILYAMREDMGIRKMKKGNLISVFVNGIEKYIKK